MRKKKKRLRIDSPKEQSRIMAAAHKIINPPENIQLTPDERVFFDSIINEIAKAEWTAHQIELAAMLARTMWELNFQQARIREEGGLVKGRDGRPVISPRKKIIDSSYDKIMSMRRSLGIHARADGAARRDTARRNDLAKLAEDTILRQTLTDEESLINRPVH